MEKNFSHSVIYLYEKNAKYYNITALILVGLIALLFVYKYWYKEPREQEAAGAVYHIQYEFGKNDTSVAHYNLILNGETGKFRGALFLADNFSDTKSGNLAKYYAGYAYYRIGKQDKALEYLEGCSLDDDLLNGKVLALQADVYADKNEFHKAADIYSKAYYLLKDNLLFGPLYALRSGILFSKAKEEGKAISIYEDALAAYPHETISAEVNALVAPNVFDEIKRNLEMIQPLTSQ